MAIDPLLTKTREELATGPGRAHSTLFDWLYRHRAALARDFDDTPPSWQHMAKIWAEAGLTDRNGKPPTTHTAGQTWRRVLQVAERRRAKEALKELRREEEARRPPAPGVHPVPQQPGLLTPEPRVPGDPLLGTREWGRAVHRPAPAPAAEAKRDPILDQMDE